MSRTYALRVLYLAMAILLLTAHASAIAAGPPIRQLTSSTATSVRPAWSQDGKSIAFQSNRDGPYHIYVMNADGTNLRQITSGNDNDDRHPNWSPDGKTIAVDTGSEIRREIALIDVATKNRTLITKLGMTAQFPSFSPDGQTIAFFLYNLGTMDLWTVAKDGSKTAPVTKDLATEANNQCTFACHAARWSPNGSSVAFSDGDNARVLLMASLTSGSPTAISPPGEKSHFPVFLADGRIVYVTETVSPSQSYTDLWIVDPNNTTVARVELAQNIQAQGPFELNKDGTELLFFSPRTGNFEIYAVTLDAAGKAALAEKASVPTGFGITRTPTTPNNSVLPFQVTPELVVLGVLALLAVGLELTVWLYRRRRTA
jgi:Tol biopolymer transport system component